MAERRWEVPVDVAREARRLASVTVGVDAARLTDVGSRMPVGRTTLLALIASGVNGVVGKWATRLYSAAVDQDRDVEVRTLTAAGIGTPCDETCYGIFADGVDEDVIVQVLHASGDTVEEWAGEGWRTVSTEPVGARYRAIGGDTLTAALEALSDGHGLVLRAGTPKAFLPKRVPLTAATGDTDGVYAVVDEVDTTAVMSLFRVADGEVHGRVDGDWESDSDLLPHVLASSLPLALVPSADVPVLLRTVDDHDTVYPALTADAIELPNDDTEPDADTTSPDFSDGVMVALPMDDATAQQLAVPGGLDPSEMHVTLAYLGTQGDVPVDMEGLAELVAEWAAEQQPLSGEVSGPATFEGSDNADNPVQVALADVPGLSEARNSLVEHLTSNGVPVNTDHGYTPHLTRSYGADPVPTDGLGGTPLNFDQVGVWHGTGQQNIPLGASVTAAGTHRYRHGWIPIDGEASVDPDHLSKNMTVHRSLSDSNGGLISYQGSDYRLRKIGNELEVTDIGTGRTVRVPTEGRSPHEAIAHAIAVTRGPRSKGPSNPKGFDSLLQTINDVDKKKKGGPTSASVTAAFNPAEARDPTGKWTAGQSQALEANRKTTAPHAVKKAPLVKVKPKPGGAGGAGGKAAAKKAASAKKAAAAKAAQAKKTALRNATSAKNRGTQAAETATHQRFLNGQAAELQAEQQRHINYMHAYAGANAADRKTMRVAEAQRQLAWRTARSEAAAKEQARHAAALQSIAANRAAPVKAPAVHASAEPVVADADPHTNTPNQLREYWTHGTGAAKIAWGSPGDYNRCLAEIGKYVHSSRQLHGQCASLHKIATGIWPATHAKLEHGG